MLFGVAKIEPGNEDVGSRSGFSEGSGIRCQGGYWPRYSGEVKPSIIK